MDQYACAVEGCIRPYLARGMCDTHYRAWKRGRLPQPPSDLPPKRPRNRAHPRQCPECEVKFLAPTSTRLYCSRRCLSRARKRKHPTKYVPPVIDMRPTCTSCGERFQRASRYGPVPAECRPCIGRRRSAASLAAGYARTHYASNRARYRELGRAWKAANRELVREAANRHASLRRARMAASVVLEFNATQLIERMSMFSGCWMCGEDWSEVEHVKPISRGGPHMLANLRPACGSCNRRKGATWNGVAHVLTLRGRRALSDRSCGRPS